MNEVGWMGNEWRRMVGRGNEWGRMDGWEWEWMRKEGWEWEWMRKDRMGDWMSYQHSSNNNFVGKCDVSQQRLWQVHLGILCIRPHPGKGLLFSHNPAKFFWLQTKDCNVIWVNIIVVMKSSCTSPVLDNCVRSFLAFRFKNRKVFLDCSEVIFFSIPKCKITWEWFYISWSKHKSNKKLYKKLFVMA